jgi:membrane-associated phospholipid phosphatase
MMKQMRPLEYTVVLFYCFLISLNLVFSRTIPYWYVFVTVNIFVIGAMFVIAGHILPKTTALAKFVYLWYPAPLILLTFKEIYYLIPSIRGSGDYDAILIGFDRWLFGFDPTRALFHIANPLLTEILQICYSSFYFLPMILGAVLYYRGKKPECDYTIFAVVFGFFLSYIGYFIYPSVGPRFTLHDFSLNDAELPGLIITQFLRYVINTGESIPPGTPNPVALVQRDVFPSGHTMMTIIVMYLAVHFKSAMRKSLLLCGSLLIFATVYLRYHYVVDVIAGAALAVVSLFIGKRFYNFIAAKNGFPIIP